MRTRSLRALAVMAYVVASANAAPQANQTSFRIVTYMNSFDQPGGIIEASAGTFLFEAGASTTGVISVTTAGAKAVLVTFPSGYNLESSPVSGPNGRYYSAIELSDDPPNVFSVTTTPGSKHLYPAQIITPSLTQNLPGGGFLGLGVRLVSMSTVFSIETCDTQGNVTQVYQFPSGERALQVMLASDGNYYGLSSPQSGAGYIFRLTPSGALTKLYTFPAETFLGYFYVPLIQASDGNLYGAIATGGANGTGIVYKMTLGGQYTPLYTFPSGNNGGPAFLLQASDGNLYGATLGDLGAGGSSELFRLTLSGQYTTLFTFSNIIADGACGCSLVQADDGIIYGTATGGGPTNGGVIFALDAGLPKPAPRSSRYER